MNRFLEGEVSLQQQRVNPHTLNNDTGINTSRRKRYKSEYIYNKTKKRGMRFWRNLLMILSPLLSYALYRTLLNIWRAVIKPYLQQKQIYQTIRTLFPLLWEEEEDEEDDEEEKPVLHMPLKTTSSIIKKSKVMKPKIQEEEEEEEENSLHLSYFEPQEVMPTQENWAHATPRTHNNSWGAQSTDWSHYKLNELSDKWEKLNSTVDDLRDIIRELKIREGYAEEREKSFHQRWTQDFTTLQTSIESLRQSDIKNVRDMVYDVMKKQNNTLMQLSPIPHHRSLSQSIQHTYDQQPQQQQKIEPTDPSQFDQIPLKKESPKKTRQNIPEQTQEKPEQAPEEEEAPEKDVQTTEVENIEDFVGEITGSKPEPVDWESVLQSYEENVKAVNEKYEKISVDTNLNPSSSSGSLDAEELTSYHSDNSPLLPPAEKQETAALQEQLADREKVPEKLMGFLSNGVPKNTPESTTVEPTQSSAALHHEAAIAFDAWEGDEQYETALKEWDGDANDPLESLKFRATFYATHYNSGLNVKKLIKKAKKRISKKKKPWMK